MSHSSRILLEKARSRITAPFCGAWRARLHGSGLEFGDIRAYEEGDDIRHIDWKTSAKKGSLYTKLFDEERRSHVWIIDETRSCLDLALGKETKRDLFRETASLLLASALATRDRIGFVQGNTHISGNQQSSTLRMLDILENTKTAPAEESLKHIARLRPRHALCIVFVDHFHIPENIALLRGLRAHNTFLYIHLGSAFEEHLSLPGFFQMQDGSFLDTRNPKDRELWMTTYATQKTSWKKHLAQLGVQSAHLSETDTLFSELSSVFLAPWPTF